MSATVFRLRGEPEQRLDLSAIPERLRGLSEREIAALDVGTTRIRAALGDMFDMTLGDLDDVRIEGGSSRLDRVGEGLSGGALRVEGDVGWGFGLKMTGGRLVVTGSARGPLAGGLMSGGTLLIDGDAGDFVGGATPGAMAGMSGGFLFVGGSAGERAGDRMRRGTIAILGAAGAFAGARLRGGTLLAREAGSGVGALMKRGTIIVGKCDALAQTFIPSGEHDLQIFRVLQKWLEGRHSPAAALIPARLHRFQGDMATLGRGEVLIAAP